MFSLQSNRSRLSLLVVAIYLLLRIPYLLTLPIFNDEANYQWRGLILAENYTYSLYVGKIVQDSLLAILMRLPGDPLLWARLCSVLFGLGTLLVILRIGQVIKRPEVGLIGALLYALSPMAIVHERLGIPDSMLTLLTTLVLLFSLQAAISWQDPGRGLQQIAALQLGGVVVLASIVKLYGLFMIIAPIWLVLLLTPDWPTRLTTLRRLAWMFLPVLIWCVVVLISGYGLYEQGKTVIENGSAFTSYLYANIDQFSDLIFLYLPIVVLVPLLFFLIQPNLEVDTRRLFYGFLGAAFGYVGIIILIGSLIYPRYFMPAWPPLLLACALAVVELWRRGLRILRVLCAGSLLGSMIWGVALAGLLMIAPSRAPLAGIDYQQYIAQWPSGYWTPGAMERIAAEANAGPITLLSHEGPQMIYSLPAATFYRHPLVTMRPMPEQNRYIDAELAMLAEKEPTYLLLYAESYERYRDMGVLQPASIIATFTNPNSGLQVFLLRYEAL